MICYIHVYMCIRVYIYIYIYICLHVFMFTYMNIWIYIITKVIYKYNNKKYIYIYKYKMFILYQSLLHEYIHIHIYIYVYLFHISIYSVFKDEDGETSLMHESMNLGPEKAGVGKVDASWTHVYHPFPHLYATSWTAAIADIYSRSEKSLSTWPNRRSSERREPPKNFSKNVKKCWSRNQHCS